MRRKIYQGLMALVIFSAIVLMNTVVMLHDNGFAHNELEKLGVNESKFNAFEADGKIRDYLAGQEKNLSVQLSDKEEKHLEDVKELFTMARILLALFVFLIVVGLFEFKAKEMSNIGMYLGGFVVLFVVSAFIIFNNFEGAFDLFHRLLFTNDLWMMSPGDKLIMLYPQQFFVNSGLAIAKRSVVQAFIGVLILNLGPIRRGIKNIRRS